MRKGIELMVVVVVVVVFVDRHLWPVRIFICYPKTQKEKILIESDLKQTTLKSDLKNDFGKGGDLENKRYTR
jgi:hypothetical protein